MKTNETNTATTDEGAEARRVSIRAALADGMLRHAHTVDLDHLQELSAFVLSGRRKKKPVETPPV